MKAIFNSAIEQNVAFVPGNSFYAMMFTAMKAAKAPAYALEFFQRRSRADTEGIRRLAAAVKSHLSTTALRSELPLEV